MKKSKAEGGVESKVLYSCDNCDNCLDSVDNVNMHNCYKHRQGAGQQNYLDLKNYFAGYPPVTLESLHLGNLDDKSMLVFNQSLSVN